MKKKELTALVKRARRSLAVTTEPQQELVRRVRLELGLTTEELAGALGKSVPTVRSWLAPEAAAKHRKLPDRTARLLREMLAASKKR